MTGNPLRPGEHGLYLPQFEHDACGVGAICNLTGKKSHKVIKDALQILVNLTHRGATGCDALTGDGAGILMQVPHKLMVARAGDQGIRLPGEFEYGVGLVFLPRDVEQRALVKGWLRDIVVAEGQEFLGWRDMKTKSDVIGESARKVEPYIEMIFIGRGKGITDARHFERKLYVIRRVIENKVRLSGLSDRGYFYIPSLSCKTIVYKGLLLADQVGPYFPDLVDPIAETAMALVHQRYSTNTFPTWDLAHPFRFICHNGEINTVRGNSNQMNAREHLFESDIFGEDMKKILPIAAPGGSDSQILDNAVELLTHTGRSLPHAMMMLIPEAWQNHATMSDEKKAFYEYHSCLMEPWDGPASIPFCDGTVMGALLDRNGLRPSRYTVTKDGFVVMGSETGVLDIAPENVELKGRLQPGRMFLVDTTEGRIVDDAEVKEQMAARKPYRKWLKDNMVSLADLPASDAAAVPGTDFETLLTRQQLHGYTLEDLRVLLLPMAREGKEALGSMGTDTPLAVLSDRPQLLYNYFKQLFAQVTNPPLDGIREELVTSLITTIGYERDLFDETPLHANQLKLLEPVVTNAELAKIKALDEKGLHATVLPTLYPIADGGDGLTKALTALCEAASAAVRDGKTILVLSDRGSCKTQSPIPALLACSAVHHHLIRNGQRTRCGIVLESGEPREVHHFCVLFAYGVGAVNPYLALETLEDMIAKDILTGVDFDDAVYNYIHAVHAGVLKVMSKMGISTLHSYRGAQIVECIGIDRSVIDLYFTATPSRIGGINIDGISRETKMRHDRAYPPIHIPRQLDLEVGGLYQWRRNGEHHLFNPLTVAKLQQGCRTNDRRIFSEYSKMVNDQTRRLCTLRGLMEFKKTREPISIDEVESRESIVKRFKSGAMSYGSISAEAHETLAIAMNRIGGRSNSGEGGEDERRFVLDPNGDNRCSAIKQVASGRFGVTSHYLVNAKELQIKMAQGAKPGEGGQLPGKKVWPWIAKVRHSTPWVGLISPPPHHDIYSIEDLAQLIHDLKNANDKARINVKLVSEIGVGTIAAGVSKGKADVVLISGWDGGTGASPQTSLKHAGLPWELGLSETHQTLVQNDLRSRIVVECDGQLKTGRDVIVACLLGAEEFGFATAPLVVTGCIMMRVCHLDTCPVGVATQDPELRKKFTGNPDHVVNFFYFIAEEMRELMAQLGFRTILEMVGHVECLDVRPAIDHWKAKGLDYSRILAAPNAPAEVGRYCSTTQDHGLEKALDHELIRKAHLALANAEPVVFDQAIKNINRTVGTMLSAEISREYGAEGLPDNTITINCTGSGGQSFAAFGARGLTMNVRGDANDYFGKGLSGARLTIQPDVAATFKPSENIIIGNVALYGATYGEAYVRGRAGERFAVRNSGARAVVEGVGDHGCEYMTGGRVVVLGPTGRNFAAGMSGGIAYIYDEAGDFEKYRCNMEMVTIEPMSDVEKAELKDLITKHAHYTNSDVALRILANWEQALNTFVKVMPTDYKAALDQIAQEAAQEAEVDVTA